jgi:catechol 2,3-dioxygenase-like lactoylglutathione lyase family enzyme
MTHLFAGLPVADLEPALAWYERLLGRPPSMRPHPGEAVWQFTDTGLIYVVTDAERAGNGLITVIVDDLAGLLAEIAARGLEPDVVPATGRARFVDPAGNSIVFAELR